MMNHQDLASFIRRAGDFATVRVARVQQHLFLRFPRYRRAAYFLARQIAFALTGNAGARRIGALPMGAAAAPLRVSAAHVQVSEKMARGPAPARVQVFRRNGLGDVLLVTPVLRALRGKYPSSCITVTTCFPEILVGNPNIDKLVKAEQPLDGFDLTIDLCYELTPELHIVDAYAQIAQVKVTDHTPEIFLTKAELARANDILRAAGVDLANPIVGMHVESGWKVRDWPLANFKKVAETLHHIGAQVVVLGENNATALDFGIDLRGKTSIREVAAVVSKCTALMTVDSGLIHVATAFRRPVVSVFGCTDPEKRLPVWARDDAVYADIVCHGCHHRQRPVPVMSAPVCPFETVRCMEGIPVASVVARVSEALKRALRPKVSIVIPHYRSHEMLDRCLESIFRCGASLPFETIVVDDSGIPGSETALDVWRPRIRISKNPENLGFSKSCNRGAKIAAGRYLVFLNDDTVVTPAWLDALVAFIERESSAAVVGPKLLYPSSNTIQHCGMVFNEGRIGEHLYRLLPGYLPAANRVRRFRALTGACFLIRRDEFFRVGGFDEAYSNGGEDTDLCLRLHAAGRGVFYCPESVVYHDEGQSRGLRSVDDANDVYNRARLAERWSEHLSPDIDDYCLLGEIEASEGQTWYWLADVPVDVLAKYQDPNMRRVGRYPFKCELGSGMHPHPGYLHLDTMADAPSLDLLHDISSPLPFLDDTVGEVLANHVIEHVSWRDLPKLAKEMHRVLRPGGQVFIRTPNLRFICESYLAGRKTTEHPSDEMVIAESYGEISSGMWANLKLFSGQNYQGNFHNNCMDPDDLVNLFQRVGFGKVDLRNFGREFSPGEIQLIAVK